MSNASASTVSAHKVIVERRRFGRTARSAISVATKLGSTNEQREDDEGAATDDLLASAFAACASFNGSNGLFDDRWKQKISAMLSCAYNLLVAIEGVEIKALKMLKAHPYFHRRKRGLNQNNPALAAVMFAAKPETVEQRKICSDHACVLIWAADTGISPTDFPRQVSEVTLQHCKKYVRDKRRSAKIALDERPAHALRLSLSNERAKVMSLSIELSERQHQAAKNLLGRRSSEVAQNLVLLLERFANEETGPEPSEEAPCP
jgi:hypothetical protein